MTALNFPDSPTNGQEHSGYVWDATNNVWNRLPTLPALDLVNFSAVAPSNPQDGQFWFDTTAGKMYVYYNDGSSAQWVSTIGGLVGQTGTEGQQLIHNGTEWVAYDGKSRNLIYNGAMQVAQRGTSETGITGSGYYTADRWQFYRINMGTWTQTVEADGPAGSGFTKSLKTECTTADASPDASDRTLLIQRLEGQDLQSLKKGTSDAESLTVSFWVKSNVTGTYIFEMYDNDNTRQISKTYSVSSADTWEKKTLTLAGDTTGVLANDQGVSLTAQFWLGAGSDWSSGALATSWADSVNANRAVGQTNLGAATSNYWQVTGVQLETGTIATPFEHKSYSTELAECQRYYTRFTGGSIYSNIAAGHAASTTTIAATWNLPTSMRIEPTSVDFANIMFSDFAAAPFVPSGLTIDTNNSSPNVVQLVGAVTGATQFRRYVLCNNNNVNGYVGVSAEL